MKGEIISAKKLKWSRLCHIVRINTGKTLCGREIVAEQPLADPHTWTDGGRYCGNCLTSVDALPHSQQMGLGFIDRQIRRQERENGVVQGQ